MVLVGTPNYTKCMYKSVVSREGKAKESTFLLQILRGNVELAEAKQRFAAQFIVSAVELSIPYPY